MILPKNGRIVIVDDNIKEAEPLMSIFSKNRIPFNYYDGKVKNLPSSSIDNKFRLLFLDLNIVESNKKAKDVISVLSAILNRIIPDNPNPYVLVIWSKNNDEYSSDLEKHFKNVLTKKRPVTTINLKKENFFDFDPELNEWVQKEDCLQLLSTSINENLSHLSVVRNLITWENIVHDNSSETINEFSSFYPFDEHWDKHTKAILFHLAKSVIGNYDIKTTSDNQKLITAFQNINSFLAERIQDSIIEKTLGDILDLKDEVYEANNKKDGIKNGIKEKINSKLHLSFKNPTINSFEQGNVYLIPNENDMLKKILFKEKYGDKKISRTSILKSRPHLVNIDLTPVCDYSQDKNYVRLIYGILLDSKYESINIKNDYQRQTPSFFINGKMKFFVFDYRYIKTLTKKEIQKIKISPRLRLRRELCTDIQAQLSNQINRPGISNM